MSWFFDPFQITVPVSPYLYPSGHWVIQEQPQAKGWECPKCGRVWAPGFPACSNCNRAVKHEEKPRKLGRRR